MNKFLATIAALTLSTAAQASTVTIASFDPASYGGGRVVGSENFEGYGVGNIDQGFATGVGTFATLGGTGSGGTVTNAGFANDGSKLALRNGNVHGRTSTTPGLTGDQTDGMFLDSNDTFGILWSATLGGSLFNQIVLTLTDAADAGARMFITAGASTTSFHGLGDGNRQTVLISFDTAVSSADIMFENRGKNGRRINDGFSIDDIQLSAVPLSASFGFLLAGLAGMGVMGRRRKD